MVIEEHARLEILLPNEQNRRYISEYDIIQNSLSIVKKCMDDSSFMLGGVFSAQLSAKFRLQETNSFNIIGSKINVFSWYGNDRSKEKLRGVFWITSASRINDIYTISASDALIWLDSTSYDASGTEENIIYNKLASDIGSLGYKFSQIIETVNEILDDDKKIEFYVDTGIINYLPSGTGYCVLPPDMVGQISTRNPRDYASWLAQIACGFVYVDYSDGRAKLRIGQFGEAVSESVSRTETELNSCEIADFIVQINGIWTNVYDGSSGGIGSCKGGVIIDISDNPFKDGHWQYNRVVEADGEEHGSAMDIIGNIGGKIWGNLPDCNGLKFRPFNLKCHCQKNFELGQKITLPDGSTSWITSVKWQFRGGYTLSCAGHDTRILSVAAKRSQAAKVKDLAYTKINTEKSKMMKEITSSNSRIETLEASDVSDWNTIQGQIEDIWQAINGG
ncbi:MAG: hypothetical protein K2J08_12120 [Ruminococcus sp.]|nr:hypothetical protein [Ruminococcus sp.]